MADFDNEKNIDINDGTDLGIDLGEKAKEKLTDWKNEPSLRKFKS